MHALCFAVLVVAEGSGSTFHTRVEPRVDPVFGDVAGLRRSVDRFLAVDAEMQEVADQFSVAVHQTLSALSKVPVNEAAATGCPANVAAAYGRAHSAGMQYLVLGQKLEEEMRQIRTAEAYGDTVALTPDYRQKVETARRDHQALLRGLREMQAAFHDQLESEMHYVGCSTANLATRDGPDDADDAPTVTSPSAAKTAPGTTTTPAPAAPVASIVIDNSHCAGDSRVAVDGQPIGLVQGNRRRLLRVTQGPHAFCVLPAADARTCSSPGTVRHAYVHDGWTLQVRCGN